MSDFIPDRINETPSVFNGCSWEELGAIGLVSGTTFFILGVLLGLVTGAWVALPAILTIGPMVSVYAASKWMMVAKRGKPVGYYKTKLSVLKKRLGLSNSKIIIQSSTWHIGR